MTHPLTIIDRDEMAEVRKKMEGKPYGVLYVNEVGPNTCGTCKYWKGYPEKETIPWFNHSCINKSANEHAGGDEGLSTHKEFGCIFWESK